MQTFITSSDLSFNARVLDRNRLGKQRIEAISIANTLLGVNEKNGWRNHPAVKMWAGYESFLVRVYLRSVLDEWARRGYKNTKSEEHYARLIKHPTVANTPPKPPEWFGEKVFRSHQSNLVRKKPLHYKHYFPNIPSDMEYYWPV